MFAPMVSWPDAVPAPGTSNVVIVPLRARVEFENGTQEKIEDFEKPLRHRRVESLNGEESEC
jgi:hypothetical protein